jgi:hypothetical protein
MGADEQRPVESLTDYIEKNHNLLAALGVMVALSLFARQLPDKILGALLSFLLLCCAVLVFLELIATMPKTRAWRMEWFGWFFIFAGFIMVVLWLEELNATLGVSGVTNFLWVASMTVVAWSARALYGPMSRTRVFRNKVVRIAVILVAVGVVVLSLGRLSVAVAPRLSRGLTVWRANADTTSVLPGVGGQRRH